MDKLEEIFARQAELNGHITEVRGLEEEWDFQTGMEKYSIAMYCEMAELLEETNYKWWKNKKTVDMAKVKEELIDILHFYVSLCINAGMTAEELYDIYMGKNKENFKRQDGTSAKPGYNINDER